MKNLIVLLLVAFLFGCADDSAEREVIIGEKGVEESELRTVTFHIGDKPTFNKTTLFSKGMYVTYTEVLEDITSVCIEIEGDIDYSECSQVEKNRMYPLFNIELTYLDSKKEINIEARVIAKNSDTFVIGSTIVNNPKKLLLNTNDVYLGKIIPSKDSFNRVRIDNIDNTFIADRVSFHYTDENGRSFINDNHSFASGGGTLFINMIQLLVESRYTKLCLSNSEELICFRLEDKKFSDLMIMGPDGINDLIYIDLGKLEKIPTAAVYIKGDCLLKHYEYTEKLLLVDDGYARNSYSVICLEGSIIDEISIETTTYKGVVKEVIMVDNVITPGREKKFEVHYSSNFNNSLGRTFYPRGRIVLLSNGEIIETKILQMNSFKFICTKVEEILSLCDFGSGGGGEPGVPKL